MSSINDSYVTSSNHFIYRRFFKLFKSWNKAGLDQLPCGFLVCCVMVMTCDGNDMSNNMNFE